ncbi:MAG: helix-turn-helix transcriptional regulator [Bacteroidales bacterium]|nr:helix-turn-helix transcriptional regulator [Bacteroidales bacterium]MBQ9311494.1 helix-turn-helix transcriptional regulator [Bacteroidales bacterium]
MAKVEFINTKRVRIETIEGDIYDIGYSDQTNYQINQKYDNHYINVVSELFDKYYDGTLQSIWGNILREMYRENLSGFLWISKDESIHDRIEIGKKIKELRQLQNLSAKDFAQKIGMDAGNLSRIEQGKFSVGLDTLNKIARALNTRIDFVPKDKFNNNLKNINNMEKKMYNPEETFSIGKNTDSFEKLESLCKEEAEKLLNTLDISDRPSVSIPFWTKDLPSELICVCNFTTNGKGKTKYNLDFSQSTL